MLTPFVKALRPHQWIKNLFVAAPLVFARLVPDGKADLRTLLAVGAFCLLSSAVYLFNDVVDAEKDRAHPVKRHRAIASGKLGKGTAVVAALVLAAGALTASGGLGMTFLAIAGAYLVLNLGYSLALKKVPFLDVGALSASYLLRVAAGAAAIPVVPSRWLFACTLLLSSLLGFGKRTHELRVAGTNGGAQRDVLGKYRLSVLQPLLVILGVLTCLTYIAYTQSTHAQTFFGTRHLVLTAPLVGYGMWRFIWLVNNSSGAESPTDSMLRDWPILTTLVLYAISILVVIYLP